MPLKSRGEQRVAVAADRIARIGRGRVLVAQDTRASRAYAGGRASRPRAASVGVVRVAARRARVEERCGRSLLAAPRRGLLRARERLAPRRDDALGHALAQRRLDARERVRDARHALGRDLPVGVGVEAHEVEALPGRLHRAADDPEVAQPFAGVVLRRRRAASRSVITLGREAVVVVVLRRRASAASVSRSRSIAPRDALGGVVGHLVVVAGDAGVGRAARVERAELRRT